MMKGRRTGNRPRPRTREVGLGLEVGKSIDETFADSFQSWGTLFPLRAGGVDAAHHARQEARLYMFKSSYGISVNELPKLQRVNAIKLWHQV